MSNQTEPTSLRELAKPSMMGRMPSQEARIKELPLNGAFSAFWKDESLHDITLKGDDGVTVGANRYALAIRSDVFHKMLLGRFKEASSNEVAIQYAGTVLEAIVEYISTDSAKLLDQRDEHLKDEMRIQNLVALEGASQFFNLPVLGEKAGHSIERSMDKSPWLSFTVLEKCFQEGPAVSSKLKEGALKIARAYREVYSEKYKTLVVDSTASMLEEILRDDKDGARRDQRGLFQILNLWAEGNADGIEAGMNVDQRKKVASELCDKHICLKELDPEFLSSSVEASGLATAEQLLEAYRFQARAANKKYGTFSGRVAVGQDKGGLPHKSSSPFGHLLEWDVVAAFVFVFFGSTVIILLALLGFLD